MTKIEEDDEENKLKKFSSVYLRGVYNLDAKVPKADLMMSPVKNVIKFINILNNVVYKRIKKWNYNYN